MTSRPNGNFAGRLSLVLLGGLLLSGCVMVSYAPGRAGLQGVVVDEQDGRPVAGVEVSVVTLFHGEPGNVLDERSTLTDSEGRWSIDGFRATRERWVSFGFPFVESAETTVRFLHREFADLELHAGIGVEPNGGLPHVVPIRRR